MGIAAAAVPDFDELAARRDGDIDVALGAALVAKDVYPQLDVPRLLAKLDALAAPLFGERLEERAPQEQARILAAYLYGVEAFAGDETDYYDPRNSLLSDVLERRRGIPITLAIVYCEVARRVGVMARGVGFPGHFLVRIEQKGDPLVVDPFFGGRLIGLEELEARLDKVIGDASDASPAGPLRVKPHLEPSSPRSTLVRLLTNLKAIYLTRGDRARAHLALDRIVSLLPHASAPLHERGRLAALLGAKAAARADLEKALTLRPPADDERTIKEELAHLGQAPRIALN